MNPDATHRSVYVFEEGSPSTCDDGLGHLLSSFSELGGTRGKGGSLHRLFASGYAACCLGALKFAGRQLGVEVPKEAEVSSTVGIDLAVEGGLGVEVDLAVALPGLDRSDAERLVNAVRSTSPYSNCPSSRIQVRLAVA